MPASSQHRRQDIAAPGQHGNHPFPVTAPAEATARLVIVESNRTKAELWQYYSLTSWRLNAVACYDTGLDGFTLIRRLEPTIVLAGLRPGEYAPRHYLQLLRAAAPAAKLILYCTVCNEYLVHTLRNADYQGLVYEPDESLATLTRVIELVRLGQRFVSASISRCLAQLRADSAAFPKLLSERHEQVLICIAHSMSDEEIARHFGFSPATALSHRQKIMQKLNIHNTPKLIRYCIEKGFNSVPIPAATTPMA